MKVFVVFIWYCIYHLYISNKLENTASEYYDNRIINNKTTPKVYDIGHWFLPDLHKYDNLHHLITIVFIIPVLFNFNIFKEFLGYWVVIFIIRSITNMLTILPKYKNCDINKKYKFISGCYDKIFSGHFSSVFLATLLYLKYNWINMSTLVLINMINSISILLSRGHYTIDLVVAFFVTLFVYQNKLLIK